MALLFSNQFPPAGKMDWLAQVRSELKSELAYESLHWQTGEGFALEPYYTVDDQIASPSLERIQAAQKAVPGWLNAPEQTTTDDENANNKALHNALDHGADALLVRFTTLTYQTIESLSRLLKDIRLSDTPLYFCLPTGATNTDVTTFVQALKRVAPYQLKGGIMLPANLVPIEATQTTLDSPRFRTVCASSHAFHNAGATATQELAFTMAVLADLYDQLTDAGLSIEQLISKTLLSVSVGTSYFLEISKLRALRVLVHRFLSAYNVTTTFDQTVQIQGQTSTFYDAAVTPYTNLLRASTEAMAAVIGGCDVLTVHPYDTVLGQPSEFSDRIARNVSVLLKHESYLDKVADPSSGSYYVEQLTHQLAEAAWTLFVDVETRGGLAKAFADGFIQAELAQSYKEKVDAVRNGKILVGVTRFRSDEMPDSQTQAVPDGKTGTLPNRRLSEDFEEISH